MIVILYGGVLQRPNISLLLEEGERRGLSVRAVHYSEVSEECVTAGIPWAAVTGIIFRGWYKWTNECLFALKMAKKHGIAVVDSGMLECLGGDFVTDKISQRQRLSGAGISVPQVFDSAESVNSFPVVLKDSAGSKGKNVFLANTVAELVELQKTYVTTLKGKFFIEEFIPSDGDFRVLVIGGKALPQALHRRPSSSDEFRSNISVGGLGAAESLAPELRDLAERAASIEKSDFCGVDIISHRDTKKLYVLEVNRFAPGFEGFQKATGINVADQVFGLLVKKISSRKM